MQFELYSTLYVYTTSGAKWFRSYDSCSTYGDCLSRFVFFPFGDLRASIAWSYPDQPWKKRSSVQIGAIWCSQRSSQKNHNNARNSGLRHTYFELTGLSIQSRQMSRSSQIQLPNAT